MCDPNVECLIAKHRERAAKGLVKYGVDTTRTDLTAEQWLQHLQEELMDGAVYCERVLVEVERLRQGNEQLRGALRAAISLLNIAGFAPEAGALRGIVESD